MRRALPGKAILVRRILSLAHNCGGERALWQLAIRLCDVRILGHGVYVVLRRRCLLALISLKFKHLGLLCARCGFLLSS